MLLSSLLWGAGALLVIGGIAGTVLPVIPGPPIVLGGLLLMAWVDGFVRVGWPTLTGLVILTLATVAIDLTAASFGTRGLRASPAAAVGAAIGTVIGLFMGFVGILVGPFAGAVVGEYWAQRDLLRAGKVGVAAWLGMVLGGAAKLAIVFVMVGWFAVAFFV